MLQVSDRSSISWSLNPVGDQLRLDGLTAAQLPGGGLQNWFGPPESF
jgi:hypothetical protein